MTADIASATADLTKALMDVAAQNGTAARQAELAVAAAQAALTNSKVAKSAVQSAWFKKVASWATSADEGASLANNPIQAAKKAALAALPVLDGPNPNDAASGLVSAREALTVASTRLGAVAESAARALAYCELMLRKPEILSNATAKAKALAARKAGLACKEAALKAQASAQEARRILGALLDALTHLPPTPPNPPVEELSTLSVQALRASMNEDGAGALSFAIARIGPLALACSVRWTGSGIASASDFVAETAMTGTLVWEPNDGAEQRLEFVPSPDLVLEADERLTVTLSEPNGAVVDPAKSAATVAILDDDSPLVEAIKLPVWPVQYNGPTIQVRPSDAQHALDTAPSGSTLRFMGAGPYPNLVLSRAHDVNLKLVSDVPAFTDLKGLHPDKLGASELDDLADRLVVGKDLKNSALLRNLLVKSGGYIWVEGFRSEFPNSWVMSANMGGSTSSSCAGLWFELCRCWQGNGKNVQFGPQKNDGLNRLNVVHRCWIVSVNEIGDPKAGGGSWQSSAGAGGAGTAICDYGVTSFQNTGPVHVLGSYFQMRANHFISLKRGVGRNSTLPNRIEGNLFTGWSRGSTRMQTCLELGQEHDETGHDYTTGATDVLHNTFCVPNSNPWFLKNVHKPSIRFNLVLMHKQLLRGGLAGGNRGTTVGPVHPGPALIADNEIRGPVGNNCQLASWGVPTTATFARNKTSGLIGIDTYDSHLQSGGGNSGPSPRVTVVRIDGDASGFAPPKAR